MWLIIIIALILILKSLMSSNKAAAISTKTVYVSQACGSSGDCFHTGKTIAVGVTEPNQYCLLRCDAMRAPFNPSPCNVVVHFPVTPPPLKIQTPVRRIFPGPMPVYGGGSDGGGSKDYGGICCGGFLV